jgi:hypothetical protein
VSIEGEPHRHPSQLLATLGAGDDDRFVGVDLPPCASGRGENQDDYRNPPSKAVLGNLDSFHHYPPTSLTDRDRTRDRHDRSIPRVRNHHMIRQSVIHKAILS